MYIQDTITMDILNPKETITCRPGAPYLPRAPRFYPKLPPLSPALIGSPHILQSDNGREFKNVKTNM